MTASKLSELMGKKGSSALANIQQRAEAMANLTSVLQHAIDEEAAAGLSSANIRDDGTLVVLSTSPAWASRLRFEEQRLLDAAKSAGFKVSRLRVSVSHQVDKE